MSAPAMHLGAASAHGRTEQACRTCGASFVPKRSWAAFCGPACRNAFHVAEARLEKIRAAAPALYEALLTIARQVDGEAGKVYGKIAADALGDLKPPVEPKALLEKAKA